MLFKPTLGAQYSGSVGGWTASHNRFGTYLRIRGIPTDPGTQPQYDIRTYFGNLAIRWNTLLTQDQRDVWEDYAANVPVQNRIGSPIYLTGLNHYVRSNVPRLQAGLDRVDDGPTIFNLGDFTSPSIDSVTAPNALSLNFLEGDEWVGEDGAAMLVLASIGKAITVNYFEGPYLFAGSIEGDSGTPPTSPDLLTLARNVAAGQRVFIQARVTRADGRLSSPFRTRGTAVAP